MYQGSLVMAESLSFVYFNHLSQLKNKNKCINITSLFNLGAVKDGGFPECAHRGKTWSAARGPSAHVRGAWVCHCVKRSWAAGEETPGPSAKGLPCISLSTEGNGAQINKTTVLGFTSLRYKAERAIGPFPQSCYRK